MWIVGLALLAWFVFGDPAKSIADWFWDNETAPWETVDAYYYPDRSNLTVHEERSGLASVDACRDWVSGQAALRSDPGIVRGDYECGIEQVDTFAGLKVYRRTVK